MCRMGYDEFIRKFAARVSAMKVGNDFDEGVVQGPLVEDAAVEKVQRHIDDAGMAAVGIEAADWQALTRKAAELLKI